METRPSMMAPAPSEASPGLPLRLGVLWASRASPCARGGWWRVMPGHRDVQGVAGMCHSVQLCHGAWPRSL